MRYQRNIILVIVIVNHVFLTNNRRYTQKAREAKEDLGRNSKKVTKDRKHIDGPAIQFYSKRLMKTDKTQIHNIKCSGE